MEQSESHCQWGNEPRFCAVEEDAVAQFWPIPSQSCVCGGLQCMHVVTALFSQPCSRNVDTELERWVKLDLAGIAICQNTPALCVWVENLT